MFEIEIDVYSDGEGYDSDIDVELKLVLPTMTFCFSPEQTGHIRNVDVEAESGKFDTSPSNGAFSLKWSKTSIEICVAKHGDGCGGSFDLTLQTTPELQQSLHDCLRRWKTTFQQTEVKN